MKKILLMLILLGLATPAAAQTVFVTPTSSLTFTASADHNGTSLQGTPLLTKYVANYCQQSAPTNCVQVDLGKPTPGANNVITIPNFFGQLTPNVFWLVSVQAQGPGGQTASPNSDPFGLDAPTAPRAAGKPVIK